MLVGITLVTYTYCFFFLYVVTTRDFVQCVVHKYLFFIFILFQSHYRPGQTLRVL